jgi:aminoglycoside phosphotransferase (APT) family kinase protein
VTIDTDLSDRLLAVLRAEAGMPGLTYARPPEPLSGGFWAQLLVFSLANPPEGWPVELVARVMPDPGLARKETIVQGTVAAAGFPTPMVRVCGGPEAGLGRAFMVMDRAKGTPLISGLSGVGAVTSALPLLRQIPEVLASSMAKLHVLDPEPVRRQLDGISEVPVTMGTTLEALRSVAGACGRTDLVGAAASLIDTSPPPESDVICHGDLHPFNLLVDGDHVTVLDWSAALLAPRAHDVAFTSLLLGEPPLLVPKWLRPIVRGIGAGLARSFVRGYQRQARVTLSPEQLRWHQGMAALRALVEVAGWEHTQTVHAHTGHPWLVSGPAIARRLSRQTGISVRAR